MVPSRLALRAGVTNIRGPLRARVTNIRGVITSTRASFEPQTGLLPHYLVPSLERHSERTAIVSTVFTTLHYCKYCVYIIVSTVLVVWI